MIPGLAHVLLNAKINMGKTEKLTELEKGTLMINFKTLFN
jgi:hypothetical protein